MIGKLYVVGTPIGNLDDFSKRGMETLEKVDFIAAEDTRVSIKLLNRFNIKKPMISYYEHNIREKGEMIVDRILNGESCAIISDAGMPCISDPGEDLVKLCHENDIVIEPIPGPTAALTALAVSGQVTSRFSFEGFLSTKSSSRMEHLQEVKNNKNTMIFYEAPHKLKKTLKDMYSVFGDRSITIARELTKIHEQIFKTTLSESISSYEIKEPRGEFVLIIEGKAEEDEKEITIEEAVGMVAELVDAGQGVSTACKEIAKKTKFSKSVLYKSYLSEH